MNANTCACVGVCVSVKERENRAFIAKMSVCVIEGGRGEAEFKGKVKVHVFISSCSSASLSFFGVCVCVCLCVHVFFLTYRSHPKTFADVFSLLAHFLFSLLRRTSQWDLTDIQYLTRSWKTAQPLCSLCCCSS